MHETDERGPADEISKRLARLETELEAQRREVASLRADLIHLREDTSKPSFAAITKKMYVEAPDKLAQPHPTVTSAPTTQDNSAPVVAPVWAGFPSPASPPAHRSVENRIGSQVFNRIGIAALLLGVALALKFAVDRHWLHFSPVGRVIAGLLAGAAVVVWSERFRHKGYAAFSYSLKAVGTGTLYLTLWAGVQIYHLAVLPAGVALAAMVAVTAWNATMAWAQDSELLAAYALVGGFATPALLGTGGNHEVFLFSYMLAMGLAVLFLLCRKPWERLLLGSLPGTVFYFCIWYAKFFRAEEAGVTALFVVLLAAPFMAVALLARQREGWIEGVATPFVAAGFLSLGLYSVLQDSGRHGWLPWMVVVLAAVYLLLMRLRRGGPAEAVHLAVAIVLLTVAIPLKADGRAITIGWLAEGVVLLWVSLRFEGDDVPVGVRGCLRWLGFVALLLGTVMAAMPPIFPHGSMRAFVNRSFGTQLLAVAALAVATYLGLRMRDERRRMNGKAIAAIAFVLLNLVLLGSMHTEISRYFSGPQLGADGLEHADADVAFSAWMMVQAAALLGLGFWKRRAFVRWQGLGLLVITIAKVFAYDMRNLSSGYRILSVFGLGALLMAVSFAYQKDWLKLRDVGVDGRLKPSEEPR